jgi:membrane protein implicated in regulation of membrane protease activity
MRAERSGVCEDVLDQPVIIWLCIIVVFVVIEAISVQLICIWFAAAALLTLISALLGAPVWLQVIVFAFFTAVFLILTRPFVKHLVKGSRIHTNADRVIGRTAIVLSEINNDLANGQVKVMNQVWTARSANGNVIPADIKVNILAIEGVKLIVEEIISESREGLQ